MEQTFIHLRLHSAYSLAEGAIRIPDLVNFCVVHSMAAVCVTDTNNLFGAVEFSKLAAKAGIQPIIGTSLPVLSDDGVVDTIVLLAQNRAGYQNLMKLVSYSYLNPSGILPPNVPLSILEKHGAGLICLTGAGTGPINRLVGMGQKEQAAHYLTRLKNIYSDRLYVEISRRGALFEELVEDDLLTLAYDQDVPLVATNQAFFLEPDMYQAHDALLCIASGRYVSETDRRISTPHFRLKTPAEMATLFSDLPEAISNTVLIAQRCAFMVEEEKPFLPPFPSDKTEQEELRVQSKQGLQDRLKKQVLTPDLSPEIRENLEKTYQDRLDFELSIITRMGYGGYYLIVADFIGWAKSQNIPVGPGRGSGAGSLVAWALNITDIDPIRFQLLFERFLNPERISMPDFDVDFCQDRRDEVIDYVGRRYGTDRVAQIITFGKLQARAVLRDVGRVLGMPYGQVDRLSKMIPSNPANPVTLSMAIDGDTELQRLRDEDETVGRLLGMALKLEGLYRHASTHAAGVVIGDRPLDELVPLYHDGKSALPATQYNMKDVESVGLVKFDFLGLKTLSIIQKTVDMVNESGGDLDISAISLKDDATYDLLRRVETLGIFQVEGAGMRDVLRKLQPSRFEEIIALVALYRPGPMDDIPRYLACKHGDEKVTYLHPLLEPILKETFGVMVYQEQVMQIAQVLGGYSLGAADLLRRAMGKKIKSEMDAQRAIFVEGAQKNGVSRAASKQLFEQIAKFAGYGFNKCHSAPYALISYQTAYLKANHPVEFMAATMTYDMGNTDKLNLYRQELNRMGILLLPPDVNHSESVFRVEGNPKSVRYALSALKGVGEVAIDLITAERKKNGPYTDVIDFMRRHDSKAVNRRVVESLIASGAFDALNPNRGQLMGAIDFLLRHVGAKKASENRGATLFDGNSGDTAAQIIIPDGAKWTHLETLRQEFDSLGFYLSSHPMEVYGDSLTPLNLTPSAMLSTLAKSQEGSLITVAGVVVGKKERISKSGNRYAFVQLSDASGTFEVTLFSEIYNHQREKIDPGAIFLMKITARIDDENLRLTVSSMELLDDALGQKTTGLWLTVATRDAFPKLNDTLNRAEKGRSPLRLILRGDTPRNVIVRLPGRYRISLNLKESLNAIDGVSICDNDMSV